MNDIEQLTHAAEEGNVEAMLQLAAHYTLEEKDFQKAEEWSDKAAETGSVLGYFYSMMNHSLGVASAKALHFWDLLKTDGDIVLERGITLLNAHRSGQIQLRQDQIDSIVRTLQDVKCHMGVGAYLSDFQILSIQDVLELIQDIDNGDANAIRVACYIALDDADGAVNSAKRMYQDREYISRDKGIEDESLFFASMMFLAGVSRTGIPGIIASDMTKSVEILTVLQNALSDDDYRQNATQELSKYQKKLFGGYRYIE